MYNLPLTDSPLRSLFELEDLLPYMNGEYAITIAEFQNQIYDANVSSATFGICCVYGVYPEQDKLVLVRVSKVSTEILWYFN